MFLSCKGNFPGVHQQSINMTSLPEIGFSAGFFGLLRGIVLISKLLLSKFFNYMREKDYIKCLLTCNFLILFNVDPTNNFF